MGLPTITNSITNNTWPVEHCRIWQCWDSIVGIMLPYLDTFHILLSFIKSKVITITWAPIRVDKIV
jgi:hypothetical protein